MIERLPQEHRYRVTDAGLRVSLFVSRLPARTLRPGLATVMPDTAANDSTPRRAFDQLEHAVDDWCAEAKVAHETRLIRVKLALSRPSSSSASSSRVAYRRDGEPEDDSAPADP